MTFPEGISLREKGEMVKKKPPFIKLLELCDTISNVYEEHVKDSHRKEWKEEDEKLLKDVRKEYGNIRIVEISEAILTNTNW